MARYGFRIGLALVLLILISAMPVVPVIGGENVPREPVGARGFIVVNASGGGDYTHIQWAIDNASDGDTVYVEAGTYYENVVLDKMVLLRGDGRDTTIINGSGGTFSVVITVDGAEVSGMKLTNADFGLWITGSENCMIANNNLSDNSIGSYIYGSENNTISGNIISSNGDDGIYLYYSHRNLLLNNTVSHNSGPGIILDSYCNDNTISYNLCCNNDEAGIDMYNSNKNILDNNTCIDNGDDNLVIWDCYRCVFKNNTLRGRGIEMNGEIEGEWASHIITDTNTVNDDPIIYLTGLVEGNVPPGAGQVILSNCTNMAVTDLNISTSSNAISVAYSEGITISNNTCASGHFDIYLYHSSYNEISNNTVGLSSNITGAEGQFGYGIRLELSDHNVIRDNLCLEKPSGGIRLTSSRNNMIADNKLSNPNECIELSESNNNTLVNNSSIGGISLFKSMGVTLSENRMESYGLHIWGNSPEEWNAHDIDVSNTVNDRPICYLKNEFDKELHSDYGQVILANCTNIVVEDQNIHNTVIGISLAFSSNCVINGNNCSSNECGIRLGGYHSNIISNNTCNYNRYQGILVRSSFGNLIENNSCNSNGLNDGPITRYKNGIELRDSNDNILQNNLVNNNSYQGIQIWDSDGNIVSNNTCDFNNRSGIYTRYCDVGGRNPGSIVKNTCRNNRYGVYVVNTNYLVISYNSFDSNDMDGIFTENIYFIRISNNFCSANGGNGIYIGSNSPENDIYNNQITSNGKYGVLIESSFSSHNLLHHNTFLDNNRGNYQARDNGSWNSWDSDGEGNYWSGRTGPDSDGDGIVDYPYSINGTADSVDNYPLTEPISPTHPVASGVFSVSGDRNDTVRFDGRASHDDKEIVNYSWEFTYLSEKIVLHGPEVVFTFDESGNYSILLTVMDTDGNIDSDRLLVTIEDDQSDDIDDGDGNHTKQEEKDARSVRYGIMIAAALTFLVILIAAMVKKRKGE